MNITENFPYFFAIAIEQCYFLLIAVVGRICFETTQCIELFSLAMLLEQYGLSVSETTKLGTGGNSIVQKSVGSFQHRICQAN